MSTTLSSSVFALPQNNYNPQQQQQQNYNQNQFPQFNTNSNSGNSYQSHAHPNNQQHQQQHQHQHPQQGSSAQNFNHQLPVQALHSGNSNSLSQSQYPFNPTPATPPSPPSTSVQLPQQQQSSSSNNINNPYHNYNHHLTQTQKFQQYQHSLNRGQIPITSFNNEISPDGSFAYGYTTGDGQQAQAQGFVKNLGNKQLEAQVVQGAYSYTSPDGTPISVKYLADEKGFRAEGLHLPTPPPIPDAIARALQYIARVQSTNPQLYQQNQQQQPNQQQQFSGNYNQLG